MTSITTALSLQLRVMKMASASTFILVLLVLLASFAGSSEPCDLFAAEVGTATVPLKHKLQDGDRLKWSKDKKIIFDRKGSTVNIGKPDDVSQNGSLLLKNVGKGHKEVYTPEVFDKDGRTVGSLKSMWLCVKEPVKKPEVTFNCTEGKVKFTCKTDPKNASVTFTWLENSKVLEKKNDRTLEMTAEKAKNKKFSCKVSNEVSEVTSDPASASCSSSESSWSDIWNNNIWFFVLGGAGVVLLLIIWIIVYCICNRRKQRMRINDEMELRLNYTNAEQHHHHQQEQHPPLPRERQQNQHRQQPAGHTGPRQNCSRHQRQKASDPSNGHPQPSPRRAAQAPKAANQEDGEVPPPLPQPRKKGPRTQQH